VTEATTCVPVSWLRLERHALGELPADERADVDAHLAGCPRCRACADRIAADAQRELPALPDATRAPGLALPAPIATPVGWRRAWLGRRHAFALAAAAAVFALVLLRPHDASHVGGPRVVAVKGGDVAIELVRERDGDPDGSTAWEPTSFAAGDRFKVLITCAPPLRVHADVVVLQVDGPAFPGAPSSIACGNRVPLPPAFRITGPGTATICVALDANAPPSRATLASGTGACIRLDRAD